MYGSVAAAVTELLVFSRTKSFDATKFAASARELICRFGDGLDGDRYIVNYLPCIRDLKVVIVDSVIPWAGDAASLPSVAFSLTGRDRRQSNSDDKIVVQLYVYEENPAKLLPAMTVTEAFVRAVNQAGAAYLQVEFALQTPTAVWTMSGRIDGDRPTVTAPTSQPSSLETVVDGPGRVDDRPGATSTSGTYTPTLPGGSDANETGDDRLLLPIILGIIAALILLGIVVVVLERYRRAQEKVLVQPGSMFVKEEIYNELPTGTDFDTVATVLADHHVAGHSGWDNEPVQVPGDRGSPNSLGIDDQRVIAAYGGRDLTSPSRGPGTGAESTAYVDYTRPDGGRSTRPLSVGSNASFAFSHMTTGTAAATPDDDGYGYLAMGAETDRVPGPDVQTAQKLLQLAQMREECQMQLKSIDAKGGPDENDAMAYQMLVYTKESISAQVTELMTQPAAPQTATSRGPSLRGNSINTRQETPKGGSAGSDAGAAHYYPSGVAPGPAVASGVSNMPVAASASRDDMRHVSSVATHYRPPD